MSAVITLPVEAPASAEEPGRPLRHGEPCTMVILGAGGDLMRRKLLPALVHLAGDGLLSDEFDIVGVALSPMPTEAFREAMQASLRDSPEAGPLDDEQWASFAERLSYVSGDLADPATYAKLRECIRAIEARSTTARGRLFYLALPPSVYETAITHLSDSGLAPRQSDPAAPDWVRVIIEKPFGTSLASAKQLNRMVRSRLSESQIYRIDHYVGKETVQNLLVFRFANSIFEPIWNRNHVQHVQITAAETVGVEHRAGYYEEAGVVRDMFQNHLLQLLALTAMEPPIAFRADAVRDEKAKVLRAIRPIAEQDIDAFAARGQYGPGIIDGVPVPGYRQEERVAPNSTTATFAAIRLLIDNWRWQGVPFFIRSGKRMPRRVTEIAIQFRRPPHLLFPLSDGETLAPNVLTMRLQPDEGISLQFEIKVPHIGITMTSVKMDFSYAEVFGPSEHSAYETLLLDCMVGDATLFTRSDSAEASWAVVDPVIEAWAARPPTDFPNYTAGTWGPAAADALIARDGARWRKP